jgi:hypothetical protein
MAVTHCRYYGLAIIGLALAAWGIFVLIGWTAYEVLR